MKPGDAPPPSNRAVEAAPAPTRRPLDPEESRWIEQARHGDIEAFGSLVERHRDRAYTLALRIVRSPNEAEEVAQDAFVRVWRALPGFRGDAAFSTWLHRIVVRRALDRAAVLRTRRAREYPVDDVPEVAEAGPGVPDPATRATRQKLERLVSELSEAQRAVVTLFYYEDRSVDEVARMLDMPENTVKTHLSRARAALRGAWLASGEES